jgi:threonine dehydratase
MLAQPNLDTIYETSKRIKPFVHRTPVLTSSSLNQLLNTKVFFKCENFQKAGVFKFRGASNAVFSLTKAEAKRGVATHSSGNHAAAISLAAKIRGTSAYIVMPNNASSIKIKAVENYGGIITFCEPTLESRETTLEQVVTNNGAVVIHPYNDYRVIAGQATASLEFIDVIPELDFMLAPVGGGGLLSGTALSVSFVSKSTMIIGTEPKGADDAFRSKLEGKIIPSVNPKTIADGLLTSLGNKTFPIIQSYVDRIITVEENSIINAMKYIWERMKIIIEPSSAVPVAALFENRSLFEKKSIGVILSDGNVDLEKLPWYVKNENQKLFKSFLIGLNKNNNGLSSLLAHSFSLCSAPGA